jgi:hypothetical protein
MIAAANWDRHNKYDEGLDRWLGTLYATVQKNSPAVEESVEESVDHQHDVSLFGFHLRHKHVGFFHSPSPGSKPPAFSRL